MIYAVVNFGTQQLSQVRAAHLTLEKALHTELAERSKLRNRVAAQAAEIERLEAVLAEANAALAANCSQLSLLSMQSQLASHPNSSGSLSQRRRQRQQQQRSLARLLHLLPSRGCACFCQACLHGSSWICCRACYCLSLSLGCLPQCRSTASRRRAASRSAGTGCRRGGSTVAAGGEGGGTAQPVCQEGRGYIVTRHACL